MDLYTINWKQIKDEKIKNKTGEKISLVIQMDKRV